MAGVQLPIALQLGVSSQFPGASADRKWVFLKLQPGGVQQSCLTGISAFGLFHHSYEDS